MRIWGKNCDHQVWFQRSVVVLFGLYFRDNYVFSPSIELPGLTACSSTLRSDVLAWLRTNGLNYETNTVFPDTGVRVLEGGVAVCFDDDELLDSLRLSRHPA